MHLWSVELFMAFMVIHLRRTRERGQPRQPLVRATPAV
jgi:hypothetical protein